MATPANQDLVITAGDTMTVVVTMTTDGSTPMNITGRTYRAQVRQQADNTTIEATFTCTVTNAVHGQITAVLSAAQTGVLESGNHVWDLEENASGVVTTVLAGAFIVLADVTR